MDAEFRLDRRDVRIALLVGAAALLVYLPALTTWFLSDDFGILTLVRQAGGLSHPLEYFQVRFYDQYYRPLGLLSHALDWTLWGQNAAAFHATNIILHALSTMLVFVLGRRFMDLTGAATAALLFGLHPANHEAVFWIAARFDLLATLFTLLALVCLFRDDGRSYVMGVACFGLALLSKESALALPIISASYDVFVRRRTWQATIGRLAPLLGLLAGYALLRAESAGLSPLGSSNRFAKLVMFAAALGAIVWIAWRSRSRAGAASGLRVSRTTAVISAIGLALVAAGGVAWPASHHRETELLGFVGYAVFYLVSPVVLPAPPAYYLDPATAVYWVGGLAAAVVVLVSLLLAARWLFAHSSGMFFAAFVAAALLPVSSMTGGTRYLYLASAGMSLLASYAWRSAAPVWRTRGTAVVAIVLALSVSQLLLAAREWRWASNMTREGLALMAFDMPPCGTRDVVLLTMPVEGRGVLTNLPNEALAATDQCAAKSFVALLRVDRDDATVEATRRADGVIELRVPRYAGNIEASRDLSTFDVPLRAVRTAQLDTRLGRLETFPNGDAQLFRLQLTPEASRATFYYYSDGRLHALR
jgi:hypothetical protein